MRLLSGVWLEHCPDWVTVRFDTPRRVLSSAVVGGGLTTAGRWLNLRVSGDAPGEPASPADTVASLARACGWEGACVGMLTAASMQSLRIRRAVVGGEEFVVLATTGLGNARRAGDRAEYRMLGEVPQVAGTINLAVLASARLDPPVMVEAVMIVTEAKVAALQELAVRSLLSDALATGTGTDAIAVFSGLGPMSLPYAGKHTLAGEILARLTLAAVGDSIGQTGSLIAELYDGGPHHGGCA